MKKLIASILTATFLATTAIAFAACTGDPKVKLIEIALSDEEYGIAVQKGNTELATQINGVLADLKGDGVTV
ncbi:MAG: transporter substrate-binding domain-containing protein, partial [Clostridiales bacterium]|nr:transporter substrate-binding domain-containing protein [Clostridiales bacterium]